MATTLNGVAANPTTLYAQTHRLQYAQSNLAQIRGRAGKTDQLALGQGPKPTESDTANMVYERAMQRLAQVVEEARAELGLAPGEAFDTSPEATANRIADFALGFFDVWREQDGREALSDEDARAQFAEFIGGAIQQGIGEAREILGALQALNPNSENKIQSIADLVQQRLDAFVKGTQNGENITETLVA